MRCSRCDTEMRITKSRYVQKNGKLYRVITVVCRNPQCLNYNMENDIYQEITVEQEN